MPEAHLGPLFEQFVGLEILRWIHLQTEKMALLFWRDANGPEVDWVLRYGEKLLPIEVKWTDSPSSRDAKHLVLFMEDHPNVKKGYVICQTRVPQSLAKGIEAISWTSLFQALEDWLAEARLR